MEVISVSSKNPLYKFINGKRVSVLSFINCPICNKQFKPKTSKNKYCSRTCYYKLKRLRGDRVKLTLEARNRISRAITKRNLGSIGWSKGEKRPEITGSKHKLWKGGRFIQSGYYWLSIKGETIAEHRYIMEKHIGRKLTRNEIIHHMNHNKLDNRIANLQLLDRSEHARIHKLYDHQMKKMWDFYNK